MGLPDLHQWLGLDSNIAAWFEFRARVLATHLKSFKESTCEAAGRDLVFGGDTFPPTFALLVGHSYQDFIGWADYTSPLLSHVEVFILSTFASYADLLCQWNQGLTEEDALRLLYRLFGYDQIENMPQSLEEFGIRTPECEVNCRALADIVELELWRARLYNPGKIPSYPVIKGGPWTPAVVHRLIAAAERMGHEGIVFQQTTALLDYPGI